MNVDPNLNGKSIKNGEDRYENLKFLQAYLGDITSSVQDHSNKASHKLFASGGSCLRFIKKHNICEM